MILCVGVLYSACSGQRIICIGEVVYSACSCCFMASQNASVDVSFVREHQHAALAHLLKEWFGTAHLVALVKFDVYAEL